MVEKEPKFRMLGGSVAWCAFSPLVIAIAFRDRDRAVSQEFLNFLDDALSSWWGTSRQRRAVVETVDMDEMTNILLFL